MGRCVVAWGGLSIAFCRLSIADWRLRSTHRRRLPWRLQSPPMKIYTRTGDDGQTGLIGGTRVAKTDDRVGAYGSVDELNAVLGLCIVQPGDSEVRGLLGPHQVELFALGSHLAAQDERAAFKLPSLDEGAVAQME